MDFKNRPKFLPFGARFVGLLSLTLVVSCQPTADSAPGSSPVEGVAEAVARKITEPVTPLAGADELALADKPADSDESPAADTDAAEGPPTDGDAAPAGDAEPKELAAADHPFPRRQAAPSLDGGVGWFNTAGPLDVEDLKGKFVLLDFWTYCCINCMHILPELKKLEHAYPNQLVVIGVHSAKFDTEKDNNNIREAILRYEIEHPVVNDAEHKIWENFFVNSWPSLRVIDPEGNIVAGHGGEITFEDLDGFFKNAIPYYRKKGTLDETPLRFDLEAAKARRTPLRFPGKVLADEPGRRLFIADSNHNRIVVTDLGGKLLETIGTGAPGRADGEFSSATFDHPQGMVLGGQTLYVADTENHLLRKVDLTKKKVVTIAGTGVQNRSGWPGMEKLRNNPNADLPKRWVGPPLKTGINSPWDLWIHEDNLYIAMAGPHQIWKMPLNESEIGPYAGNGHEDIVDGPLLPRTPGEQGYSSFAQPSGLASDGTWLYVADSEGSSIRAVPFDPKESVKTIVGTAHLYQGRLFAFGDVDGVGNKVRLQHALGVVWHDGLLYVADTYNNKIKQIDPDKLSSTTIAGTGAAGNADKPAQFDEPAGISYAAGKLYIADTNNHAIRVIDLAGGNQVSTLSIAGLKMPEPPRVAAEDSKPKFRGAKQIRLKAHTVKPVDGNITLKVNLQLPLGWKINALAPQRHLLETSGDAGPIDAAGLDKVVTLEQPVATFDIPVRVKMNEGTATLKLSAEFFYCQEVAEGVCKTGSAIWTVPIKLSPDAKLTTVELKHRVE